MKVILAVASIAIIAIANNISTQPGHQTWFSKPAQAQTVEAQPPPTQFARTFHEQQNSICINNRTREHYRGELVSREEVVHELSKHFVGDQIEIMAAITISEGQRDLNCIGDELPYLNGKRLWGKATADGRTWGESLGLFQIRTIQQDNTPGSCRNDATIRASIQEQVRCAKEIYNSQGYRAWSQYSSGAYKAVLGK